MTPTAHLTILPGPIMNTDFLPVDDNGTAFPVRLMQWLSTRWMGGDRDTRNSKRVGEVNAFT
jgi:hypothetical protein